MSTATVSNAFNRPDQLSAKLRQKILQQASELGYHGPNLAARSLRRGESGVIGVMLADSLSYSFSDPMANELLQGVAEVLMEHKKQLLLLSSDEESAEQSSAESLPDGFIFYGAPRGNSFERIVQAGKPVIAVDFEQDQVGSVNIDNFQAAQQVASLALSGGGQAIPAVLGMRIVPCDRVCRLMADDLASPSQEISRQRLNGYLSAAQSMGIDIAPHQVWHVPVNTPGMAEQAVHEALTTSPTANVLLCMSDVIALAAIRVAKRLNISVPDQLKVVGFDDIPAASHSVPSLTTVSQQGREKGRLAARMLMKRRTDAVLLDVNLVERDSTSIPLDDAETHL